MHLGKQIRLRRIWKHGRAVIIPYDHGFFSGPQYGIDDPLALTALSGRPARLQS